MKMKRLVFSFVLTSAFLIPHLVSAETAPASKAASGLVEAGNKFCPISGDKVTEKGGSVVYKGKKYGLCCPMCAKDFKKDPEKFIAKLNAKEKAPGTVEVKPMKMEAPKAAPLAPASEKK